MTETTTTKTTKGKPSPAPTPEPTTPEPVEEPTTEEPSNNLPEVSAADRQKALGEIYAEATKWLKDEYLAEFNAKRAELAKERGIEWSPKPSPQEKAAAEIRRLAEENGLDLSQLAQS